MCGILSPKTFDNQDQKSLLLKPSKSSLSQNISTFSYGHPTDRHSITYHLNLKSIPFNPTLNFTTTPQPLLFAY